MALQPGCHGKARGAMAGAADGCGFGAIWLNRYTVAQRTQLYRVRSFAHDALKSEIALERHRDAFRVSRCLSSVARRKRLYDALCARNRIVACVTSLKCASRAAQTKRARFAARSSSRQIVRVSHALASILKCLNRRFVASLSVFTTYAIVFDSSRVSFSTSNI